MGIYSSQSWVSFGDINLPNRRGKGRDTRDRSHTRWKDSRDCEAVIACVPVWCRRENAAMDSLAITPVRKAFSVF